MAEPLFQRLGRIVSAKLEDAVDWMEVTGNDSLMRETIREIDRALDQVQGEHEEALARRLQAGRQQTLLRRQAAELTERARFALAEGREDLATAALGQQIDLEEQADRQQASETRAAGDEARLGDELAALKARKAQMEQDLDAFLTARREAAMAGAGRSRDRQDVERRVSDAGQAFDRARGSVPPARAPSAEAEAASRLAEIEALHRQATLAARLAALKQG